ncbi:MAG TPA: MBL fold metallo-hydrolase [Clostridia bacterium]|nr:MBL fold metallo-hydrolase [Clostridia bacterium]
MSPENKNKNTKDIRLIWHGHSCFEIRSREAVIVFDPYLEVPGYGKLDLQADLVLVSHEHDDHNARERVTLSGRAPDVKIEVIETSHDPEGGKLRGENKVHIVTIAGKRIAHLGDLGRPLSRQETRQLQNLDVLLIPVGGHYTIDAQEAAAIVRATRPDITVPMHYRDGKAGWEVTSGVQPFLTLFDQLERHDASSFVLGEFNHCILILKNPKQT